MQFVHAFPFPTTARRVSTERLWFLLTATALMLSLTPLIAVRTDLVNGVLKVTYGPLHPLYGVYFVAITGSSLATLVRKWRASNGLQRLQAYYVFVGVLLLAAGGIVANLLIPLLFNSSRFSPYGPLFSLFMSALIAHSIIRHRLMNTRPVVRRGITYLLAASVTAVAFFAAAALLRIIPSDSQRAPGAMQLALVLVVAFLFHPLKTWIQASLDSYVFRESYDYQKAIREISRTMASILDLNSLLAYTCTAIDRTVRPEFIAVYGIDTAAERSYRSLASTHAIANDEPVHQRVLLVTSPIVGELLHRRRPISRDELSSTTPQHLAPVAAELRRLNAHLAFPIFENDTLTGFFLLGSKLSGDPYFTEDLDLLGTLVSQAAIAIRNAQLYSQVVLASEYIENILSTLESAVVAVDAEGAVTLFNAAAERLTQLTASQVRGKPLDALPPEVAKPLRATISDRHPQTPFEAVLADPSGRLTSVMCATSTLQDRAGGLLGAVGVFSDLSRIKELETDKRRAERLASIGALAAGVAHEIKNPLVAIKTFAELLPERFADADFRDDFSKIVIREIDRIDGLVDRLRGLATTRGQSLSHLDLRIPIEETLALLRVQLEQARVEVDITLNVDRPLIAGNVAQLKQLFLNLFVNALEAMPSGGQLSVKLIRSGSDSQRLSVEIRDAGTGIPENVLGTIFDPFTTTKPRGSGLGLSICRGIADAHRATIQAKNNEGAGATITVDFPALDDIPAVVMSSTYREAGGQMADRRQ